MPIAFTYGLQAHTALAYIPCNNSEVTEHPAPSTQHPACPDQASAKAWRYTPPPNKSHSERDLDRKNRHQKSLRERPPRASPPSGRRPACCRPCPPPARPSRRPWPSSSSCTRPARASGQKKPLTTSTAVDSRAADMRPARPGRGRAGPRAAALALAPLALLLALGARPAAASSETVRSESAAAQQQPPCEAVGLSPGGTRVQRPGGTSPPTRSTRAFACSTSP